MENADMIFDLQLFAEAVAEEDTTATETDTEPQEETDKEPIPPELEGLSEETARAAMQEAKDSQADKEEAPANDTAEPNPNLPNSSIPYARFKEKVDETNELKAKLAEYERRFGNGSETQQTQTPQSTQPQNFTPDVQPQAGRPIYQPIQQTQATPPPMNFTPEAVKQINDITHKRALQLAGMTDDDVAALEYAEDGDPKTAQWQMAQEYARGEVMRAVQQERENRMTAAREFLAQHEKNVQSYNDFATKEAQEPDFQAIQNYAVNDYFLALPANVQPIIAEAYDRILRQTASPQDIYTIKNYYTAAKNDYRAKNGGTVNRSAVPKPAASTPKPQKAQMPRAGNVRGSMGADGAITAESLMEMEKSVGWEKLPRNYRDMLMGIQPIGG